MENITFDRYLTNSGLTEVIFCQALNISQKELEAHKIFISLTKTSKKKGLFWQMQAFLDDHKNGISLGIGDYKEKQIKKTIDCIKSATGKKNLPGIWPRKNQPFITWLKEQYAYASQTEAPIAYALEMFMNFVQKLPCPESLQKQYDDLQPLQNFLTVQERKSLVELAKMIADLKMIKEASFLEKEVYELARKGSKIFLFNKDKQQLLKIISSDCIKYQGILFNKRHFQQSMNLLTKFGKLQHQQQRLQLLTELSQELVDKISELQRQAGERKFPLFRLSSVDQKFITEYGNNHRILWEIFEHHDIQNLEQLIVWIEKWVKRVEKELQAPPPATDYEVILALVAASPKYGVTTYAMWLGKSKAKSLIGKNIAETFRGVLGKYSIVDITRKIEDMLSIHGLLDVIYVGKHDLPVLVLSEKGRELLKIYDNDESLREKKITKENKKKKKSEQIVTPKTPEVPMNYMDRLQDAVENKDRYFWLSFLEDSVSIKKIAEYEEEKLAQIQKMLDENIPGWKIPLLWELEKHPIKNKPLKRLL